jgi:hypothetical protein
MHKVKQGRTRRNVAIHMVREREYFLPFEDFPWFRTATLDQLFEVQLLHEAHLYWPRLDVDLDLDRIKHPDKYPLIAEAQD